MTITRENLLQRLGWSRKAEIGLLHCGTRLEAQSTWEYQIRRERIEFGKAE